MALEFVGEGAEALSIDERLAVANMAVEAGSETGFFPADETIAAYLDGRTDRPWAAERSDPGADVAQTVHIDLAGMPPLVALPHSPGNVVPLAEAAGRRIDQVYIGNCSNGTMTDLRQAAEMLRGRKVHPRTRAIIVPASQRVYREALAEGLLDLFVESGAMVSMPTCGACFGGSGGVLAPGENAVDDDEPQLPRPDGLERGGRAPGERVGRGGSGGRRRDRRSGRARGCRMNLEGRAIVIRQDDVDTDVLYPGTYLNVTDVRADDPVPVRGARPVPARPTRRRHGARRRLELRHRLFA